MSTFNDCQTNEERKAFLAGHPITIDSQMCMDGSAKVGDPNAVSMKHRAVCRGVQIGDWCDTAAQAATQAEEFLKSWDGAAS
ncbi:MAG: hypothetical protein CL583_01905 [Alteromonadaceae bacterium]|nr:hypothetical protein [Alteromonadaceae bacterium]|tara:strand:+ start:2614 stop:2859 length:246 start_codon:yes stop_codon:yes gene_type:complete